MDRIKIGDIELIAVTDGAAPPVSPSWPFPEVPENDWNSHRYALDPDGLHTSNFGCFVIRDKEATILVDTGMGIIHLRDLVNHQDFCRAASWQLA
ncbi:MAG: hypothetical protein CM1200mP39_27010 [Dehalococcoidia bacterium]|nr:MAG: hypothetical protein CM1200mP39_27010 [Dehalococcoidia bacterium]